MIISGEFVAERLSSVWGAEAKFEPFNIDTSCSKYFWFTEDPLRDRFPLRSHSPRCVVNVFCEIRCKLMPFVKGKGKGHPRTVHEGPEGE
jgi:hypothetical protein